MNYAAAIFIPFWHRAGSVAEQSRAEPSRAGLSRAEPSRAEQGQAEPSRASAETSRAEIRGGKYTLLCCGGFREGLLTSPRHNQPYIYIYNVYVMLYVMYTECVCNVYNLL